MAYIHNKNNGDKHGQSEVGTVNKGFASMVSMPGITYAQKIF